MRQAHILVHYANSLTKQHRVNPSSLPPFPNHHHHQQQQQKITTHRSTPSQSFKNHHPPLHNKAPLNLLYTPPKTLPIHVIYIRWNISNHRLLRLYEGRQYREAAGFLMRLPHYTLRAALPDIPIDLLIETLPHSLVLLEALYARSLELGVKDAKVLRLEQLLWKVVGLVAQTQDHGQLRAWSRLLSALNRLVERVGDVLLWGWCRGCLDLWLYNLFFV